MKRKRNQNKTGNNTGYAAPINGVPYFSRLRYQKLLALGKTRKEKLDDALQGYNLVREAGELSAWITEKVSMSNADVVQCGFPVLSFSK